MQPRAYDDEAQAIDRVVRSILSWEACEEAAKGLDNAALMTCLEQRQTARAEDMIRDAVMSAHSIFNRLYGR
jgi:xylose isomerase